MKLWIVLFVLVLPLLAALALATPSPATRLFKDDFLPPIPAWSWVLVAGLGGGIRFYRLTTLSAWPMPDEGLIAAFGMNLGSPGSWSFFYGKVDTPFLIAGCLGPFFKIFPPSLFSLWLFPALVSTLVLGVGWAASRLFPRPLGFLLFFQASLGFGVLYTGRFCMSTALTLFYTAFTLAFLAWWLQKPRAGMGKPLDWALGIVVGLGFAVGTGWPTVALAVMVAVEWRRRSPKPGKGAIPWGFWLPLALMTGAFLFFCWREGYGTHIRELWAFRSGTVGSQQWVDSFSNVAALFWGTPTLTNYGPVWGGILNPVLSACFFLGTLEAWRLREKPLVRWMAFAFLLFLSPGLISKEFEFFRVLPVLVPLFFFCALGLLRLAGSQASPKGRTLALGALLAASAILDGYHLLGPYRQTWGNPEWPYWPHLKTSAAWRAYGILKEKADKDGPGVLLSDFQANVIEQTLNIAADPFDAARNPSLPMAKVRWAALIVNADEKPYLSREFPAARWFWLGMDPVTNQYMALAVIPWSPPYSKRLEAWTAAERLLQPVTVRILNAHPRDSGEDIVRLLLQARPAMAGDRFLEGSLWEKVAYQKMKERDDAGALEAVDHALEEGFPAGHLYYLKGTLLGRLGRTTEARRAFEEAAKRPMNFTPALENLHSLAPPPGGKGP